MECLGTLVPIRLIVDEDNTSVRDTFLWSLTEPYDMEYLTQFAEYYCEDQQINVDSYFHQLIANHIQTQVKHYLSIYKKIKEFKLDETRFLLFQHVVIELDIKINDFVLRDKFEWEFRNDNFVTPEQFALQLVNDLQIDPHFCPIIAVRIREQLWAYLTTQVQHYEQNKEKIDLKGFDSVVPPYVTAKRFVRNEDDGEADEWSPEIIKLNKEELEKLEKMDERERRVRKRR